MTSLIKNEMKIIPWLVETNAQGARFHVDIEDLAALQKQRRSAQSDVDKKRLDAEMQQE